MTDEDLDTMLQLRELVAKQERTVQQWTARKAEANRVLADQQSRLIALQTKYAQLRAMVVTP